MENVSVLKYPGILNDINDGMDFNTEKTSKGSSGFSPAIIKVIAEGGENFFLYLKRLNLSKESNLLALSSMHHYYYDENELQDVRTLINIKKLNHIKQLDRFLENLVNLLPSNANFIGCFSDDMNLEKTIFPFYRPSRLSTRLLNFIDSRTDRFLDKSKVTEILKKNGFSIIDMTEIDGLTYFYAQNVRKAVELRA